MHDITFDDMSRLAIFPSFLEIAIKICQRESTQVQLHTGQEEITAPAAVLLEIIGLAKGINAIPSGFAIGLMTRFDTKSVIIIRDSPQKKAERTLAILQAQNPIMSSSDTQVFDTPTVGK